jgi:hypothetical protein
MLFHVGTVVFKRKAKIRSYRTNSAERSHARCNSGINLQKRVPTESSERSRWFSVCVPMVCPSKNARRTKCGQRLTVLPMMKNTARVRSAESGSSSCGDGRAIIRRAIIHDNDLVGAIVRREFMISHEA